MEITETLKRRWGTYLAILIIASLFVVGSAMGLPCRGQIVTTGDSEEDVAGKCGEAMFKEQRVVKLETLDRSGADSGTTTTIDVWAFDFGPDELMQSYRFENGKVAEIATLGYGRRPDAIDDTCRNGELLTVGDSSLEAFLKCGEPLAKERLADKVIETKDNDETYRTTIPVVEWTYRYGPDLPGYTLRIENGTVTNISAREFGK